MRKYWRRKRYVDSDRTCFIIHCDVERAIACWTAVDKDTPYDIKTTSLEHAQQRFARYPEIYKPITKKQYLLSKVAGRFIE